MSQVMSVLLLVQLALSLILLTNNVLYAMMDALNAQELALTYVLNVKLTLIQYYTTRIIT